MTDAAILPRRLVFRIPVIGWFLRDLIHGEPDNVWYFLGGLVSLWIISAVTWGLPGLVLPALAAVPLCFVLLVLITRG